eukprot:2816781-Prymnesium_polylepis.1
MSIAARALRLACALVTGAAAGASSKPSSIFSEPSTTADGEAAARSKKLCAAGHTRGSTSSTCFSALGLTARIICQKTESQMSAIARTPAMHVDEAPLRIEARSLPPFSAPMSASSC